MKNEHRHSTTRPSGLIEGASYRDLPLSGRGGPFEAVWLDRAIDALNQAWDCSPRISVALFEMSFPDTRPAGYVSSIEGVIAQFFQSLGGIFKRDRQATESAGKWGRSTRLWGIWAMDNSETDTSKVKIAIIANYDACYRQGRPGATEANMAEWIHQAYSEQSGRRGARCIDFDEQWIYPIYGYGDLPGYKEAFRRLSALFRYPNAHGSERGGPVFGCGLFPSRLTDTEFYSEEALLFLSKSVSGDIVYPVV